MVDDEDAELYPSASPGQLPSAWCHPRVLAYGTITGTYVLPGHPVTLAALRTLFRRTAITYGLDDLDGAAIRDGRPRALTQAISRWINTLIPRMEPVSGIEFDSRHGDGLTLWAVYEQGGDPTISPHIVDLGHTTLTPDNADLTHAMDLLNIVWSN